MKYIEKNKIEAFLKSKGYNIDFSDATIEEQRANNCWRKSDAAKVNVPRSEFFQSKDLPRIFTDNDLLNEFRKL
ncbi:MAG: hypothetical protein ACYDCN_05065 [Bacteroidia bacterium]